MSCKFDNISAVAFKMRKSNDNLSLIVNNELRKYGLTYSQLLLLHFLSQRKGEETAIKDIEKLMQLTHPTVLGIVARLCAKGFVKTKTSDKDKRIRLVSLADNDFDIAACEKEIQQTVFVEFKENFSKSEIETLAESLNYIVKIME